MWHFTAWNKQNICWNENHINLVIVHTMSYQPCLTVSYQPCHTVLLQSRSDSFITSVIAEVELLILCLLALLLNGCIAIMLSVW